MARGSAVIKALIFFTFSLHSSSALTHSLHYFYTGVRGINFPEFTAVGLVDGKQFMYYDSNIKKTIPKTEWIQKLTTNDMYYWNRSTQNLWGHQESFKINVDTVMQRFNHTTGVHTFQRMYGCERDDDGTVRGYDQWGYDGEDFISLDVKTVTWTAAKPQAVITKNKWDNDVGWTLGRKNYLEKICIEWLQKYVSHARDTLERKDPPTASVFQKHSPPEVVCHATGFFPKAVILTWRKDGEDVLEDVDLRETLPNQDGSFQKRSVLKVPAEELQKHKYTCVIQHSSLKKMVLDVAQDGGSDTMRDRKSDGGPNALIIGVVAGLVVLIAVITAVVLFWKKKKNTDFKPLPQNSARSSEVDSSSNNSTEMSNSVLVLH